MHKFWSTQPDPRLREGPPLDDGYIEALKPREEIHQEPYPLPEDFEWSTLDIDDPEEASHCSSRYDTVSESFNQIKELHDFLS
ncbi:hypothetical protein C8F04DRAFT_1247944 [Mycena alexandri]|uniref:Glycylpeptide N-tetradecanoyltransferase n=1 Tax=Mycena alexandri TaxID=1745969 RepID=A0AAD6XG45_9AGAR|nr:hypothetical protein C8F04DRAFT_1247944 [Mycena alexandri]